MPFVQGKDRLNINVIKLLIILEDLLDALQLDEINLRVASEHAMTHRRFLETTKVLYFLE